MVTAKNQIDIARVAIFGLHSGFVRARPRSVLLMIIHGDVVVTCTNAYFNRCSPTAHIGASRSSTLANSYGPVVELVDTTDLGSVAREGVWVRVPPGPRISTILPTKWPEFRQFYLVR